MKQRCRGVYKTTFGPSGGESLKGQQCPLSHLLRIKRGRNVRRPGSGGPCRRAQREADPELRPSPQI